MRDDGVQGVSVGRLQRAVGQAGAGGVIGEGGNVGFAGQQHVHMRADGVQCPAGQLIAPGFDKTQFAQDIRGPGVALKIAGGDRAKAFGEMPAQNPTRRFGGKTLAMGAGG